MSKAGMKTGRLDLLGSIISFSCAIHCLLFPILISMGSLIAISGPSHLITELVILTVSILLCLWSLSSAYPIHKEPRPLVFFGLSVIIFALAHFSPTHWMETTMNVTGALCVTAAHLLNRKYLKAA